MEARTSESVRWGWVAACEIPGAVLIAVALWTEDRWGWAGAVPAVFVNLGTALLLAGVLFGFERHFTRAVGRVASQVAEQVTSSVADRFDSRTSDLEHRIDDLASEVEVRREARSRKAAAAVEALDLVSFDSVTEALRLANDINALHGGVARVHASPRASGLRLEFRWGRSVRDDGWSRRQVGEPKLTVAALAGDEVPERDARYVLEVEWLPEESAARVGDKLAEELTRLGWWTDGGFDWPRALRNLQRTVDVSITSRRRAGGGWRLGGAVVELVGSDWAVSEAGLEAPDRRYLVSAEQFPSISWGSAGQLIRPQEPERPTWADADEWVHLLKVAWGTFPDADRAAVVVTPSWIPERSAEE